MKDSFISEAIRCISSWLKVDNFVMYDNEWAEKSEP